MASGSGFGSGLNRSEKKKLAKEYRAYDDKTPIISISEYLNEEVEQLTLREKEEYEEKEKAPTLAKKKKEYVKSTGGGHEAMGEGDSGGDGENRKNDHGGGGGDDGSGGGEKKEEQVYCEICEEFINSNVFETHLREIHLIFRP